MSRFGLRFWCLRHTANFMDVCACWLTCSTCWLNVNLQFSTWSQDWQILKAPFYSFRLWSDAVYTDLGKSAWILGKHFELMKFISSYSKFHYVKLLSGQWFCWGFPFWGLHFDHLYFARKLSISSRVFKFIITHLHVALFLEILRWIFI